MNRSYKHTSFSTIGFDKSIKGFVWYSTKIQQPSGINRMNMS